MRKEGEERFDGMELVMLLSVLHYDLIDVHSVQSQQAARQIDSSKVEERCCCCSEMKVGSQRLSSCGYSSVRWRR